MDDQTAAAFATIGKSVDWERAGFNLQAIVEAGNRGELGKPLTDWLASKGWEKSVTTKGKFVANNSFKLKKDGGICSCLGDNFQSWFAGKVEDIITPITLHPAKLRQSSLDGPIIEELGGEAKAETALLEIYDLMAKQANGEKGVLLTNGWANIFYVRDNAGVLRAVDVCWDDDGWYVGALPVDGSFRWRAGLQVFSRNVLKSSGLLAPAQA